MSRIDFSRAGVFTASMIDSPDHEVLVFNAAVQLSAADRATFLETECGGDAELIRRVKLLLQAHEQAGAFLSDSGRRMTPASSGEGVIASAEARIETSGAHVERYKLMQQLGAGGCGVVYMAQQEEPVRRVVALKVIKLGMDTRQVIARFEAERQALALMEHPSIAKVFDAGATETGRPYFVMELVRGIKITDFCDEQNASIEERLALFI